MEPVGGAQPERTGLEGAAVVFSAAAVVNVALSLALRHTGWLGEIGAHRFLFLGLELAALGLTISALALAVDNSGSPSLLCGGCGLRYPVEDGIPVMLIEEADSTA